MDVITGAMYLQNILLDQKGKTEEDIETEIVPLLLLENKTRWLKEILSQDSLDYYK